MHQKIVMCLLWVLCCFIMPVKAQSLKELFNNEYSLTGTWNYEGFACELKSDNILKKAGGKLGTSFLESKMDEYGERVGLIPGKFEYIFKDDNTFINNCGTHTFGGTYSLNKKTGIVTLTYLKAFKFDTVIRLSDNKLCLLMDADKLLKFLTVIGSWSDSPLLKNLSSLTEKYDGALLGFELSRK